MIVLARETDRQTAGGLSIHPRPYPLPMTSVHRPGFTKSYSSESSVARLRILPARRALDGHSSGGEARQPLLLHQYSRGAGTCHVRCAARKAGRSLCMRVVRRQTSRTWSDRDQARPDGPAAELMKPRFACHCPRCPLPCLERVASPRAPVLFSPLLSCAPLDISCHGNRSMRGAQHSPPYYFTTRKKHRRPEALIN